MVAGARNRQYRQRCTLSRPDSAAVTSFEFSSAGAGRVSTTSVDSGALQTHVTLVVASKVASFSPLMQHQRAEQEQTPRPMAR